MEKELEQIYTGQYSLIKFPEGQMGETQKYRITLFNPIVEFFGSTIEDCFKQAVDHLKAIKEKQEEETNAE